MKPRNTQEATKPPSGHALCCGGATSCPPRATAAARSVEIITAMDAISVDIGRVVLLSVGWFYQWYCLRERLGVMMKVMGGCVVVEKGCFYFGVFYGYGVGREKLLLVA